MIKKERTTRSIILLVFMLLASTCFLPTLLAQSKYPTVVIETNHGTMKAVLYDDTPVHSDHYLKLIRQGYFNGTLFHRVVKDFVIQGGAQDSRNARPGQRIGSGRKDMELMPEFREQRYHKRGALAAPRKGDQENPQKKSDASQFYIVQGKKYTEKQLDSIDVADNAPVRNKLLNTHYTPRKQELERLKANNPKRYEVVHDSLLAVVDSLFMRSPSRTVIPEGSREVYKKSGGVIHLNGSYTVFGEVVEGLETIDKIAALPVDAHDRPVSDVKIVRVYIE
ncbi:MAG: peptidylprolyl isomerase [Bacteroidota bacterium]|jgi:peptidyl-prolyl cis-trans isomerase B (cyclophilin B)|nr:peptidylprolyl isomerase [Bacteroidota bacterium]HHU96616.1 peptidylprolyl isomerase [Petrimonas sp.]